MDTNSSENTPTESDVGSSSSKSSLIQLISGVTSAAVALLFVVLVVVLIRARRKGQLDNSSSTVGVVGPAFREANLKVEQEEILVAPLSPTGQAAGRKVVEERAYASIDDDDENSLHPALNHVYENAARPQQPIPAPRETDNNHTTLAIDQLCTDNNYDTVSDHHRRPYDTMIDHVGPTLTLDPNSTYGESTVDDRSAVAAYAVPQDGKMTTVSSTQEYATSLAANSYNDPLVSGGSAAPHSHLHGYGIPQDSNDCGLVASYVSQDMCENGYSTALPPGVAAPYACAKKASGHDYRLDSTNDTNYESIPPILMPDCSAPQQHDYRRCSNDYRRPNVPPPAVLDATEPIDIAPGTDVNYDEPDAVLHATVEHKLKALPEASLNADLNAGSTGLAGASPSQPTGSVVYDSTAGQELLTPAVTCIYAVPKKVKDSG